MLVGSAAFVWLAVDGSAGDPPVGNVDENPDEDPGDGPIAEEGPFNRRLGRQP